MRFPSFEQTVPYFSLSQEAINILPVITNGDYADDINYHYFQLLHPARPRRLWGQLPVEEPPPAAVHSLAEPSDCVTLCLSPSPSRSFFSSFCLLSWPLFHPFYFFSVLSLLPASVNESKKPHILSRVGQWMNEVRWKLIVERSEMSCEGIHGTDCTDSSIPVLSHCPFLPHPPPPHPTPHFILLLFLSSLVSLLYLLGPTLNLDALSLLFPLSLTPDMKHPFPPHEIWRGPSWIVYRLAACMPMAAGGQAQVFRQATVGEGWWRQGGLAPPNMLINLLGLIILACSLLRRRDIIIECSYK